MIDCKVCGEPTKCSEDAVKVTCTSCINKLCDDYADREKENQKKKGWDLKKDMPNVYKMLAKEGKLSEAKKVKYKENDWKKINKLAKKKDVMIQTAFGDEFKWEEGSREGVFASEIDGREIELSHDDIDTGYIVEE